MADITCTKSTVASEPVFWTNRLHNLELLKVVHQALKGAAPAAFCARLARRFAAGPFSGLARFCVSPALGALLRPFSDLARELQWAFLTAPGTPDCAWQAAHSSSVQGLFEGARSGSSKRTVSAKLGRLAALVG
eukprot:2427401-Amphidinium_carterae.1